MEDWQESVEGYAGWYLGNPFGRAWWDEEGRYFFADAFVNHVDQQLEGTATDSHAYWLGVRARLLGSGSEEIAVGESSCPPKNSIPNITDSVN